MSTCRCKARDPRDVLWLVDGVRINNRIFNDTSPDALPANMIERIEVLKGGESLFYGTQGVAGAINIGLQYRMYP
jgi:vitamin B12 transporter